MRATPAVALAADDELPRVIALVAAEFPELPIDERAVEEVHQWSRNILAIKADGDVAGSFAALLLNSAGHETGMTQRLFPVIEERDEPGPFERSGIVQFCPVCGGSSIVHCCEGARAQPVEKAEEEKS